MSANPPEREAVESVRLLLSLTAAGLRDLQKPEHAESLTLVLRGFGRRQRGYILMSLQSLPDKLEELHRLLSDEGLEPPVAGPAPAGLEAPPG